ncbi:unnamed protein product [Cuscuta campestris]|uniref:ABC transmembrane type-1 domain-containing protein n=1 Tax=Cuscuta campestris TaxID=132261 RepID=A0A484LF99_9ASTE|nr:unnamed protein product [Cuscuta campestris]
MNNARKSSARPSSARNSLSSPIMTRNSSYGRLSDFSTSDFTFSLNAPHHQKKLAFKEQASSFWRLAKMNSPEWVYALVGSIGSVVCGSLTALFAYVLSAVLSVYYNPEDHAYMTTQISKYYCYLMIGVSSAALVFNTLQHFFWDVVSENLTRRVREKMLAAVLKNEMAWFDREKNESCRVVSRLVLDASNVRSAIGDRISLIMQNSTLMVVASTVAPIPGSDRAHEKGTQLAGEAVANVRTVAAFNSEAEMVVLYASNLQRPLRRCFWKGQIAGSGYGLAQFLLYASYALGLCEAEIIEAATLANAHKFVSALPDGYKTFVGENGVQLSGGQKQWIAIARAFMKKRAEVVLLDEATSALDAESERCMQEALDRVCAGKTAIVVAHRLSTVRNAHVIAVIDEGKVAEQGSHSHLLKHHSDGVYARMIQLQRFSQGEVASMANSSTSSHEYGN